MEYCLTKVGRGKKSLWVCRVEGHKARGSGSRPDLAIRDYNQQRKRWDEHDKLMARPLSAERRQELLAKQAAIRVLNTLADAEQQDERFDFSLQ